MSEEEKPKSSPTRMTVTACNVAVTAKNARGDTYTIYELTAFKEDGSEINEKLRSFENLPLDELIEVTVTPYNSEKYGRSFTIAQRNRPNSAQLIRELKTTVLKLTERVEDLEEWRRTHAADPDT